MGYILGEFEPDDMTVVELKTTIMKRLCFLLCFLFLLPARLTADEIQIPHITVFGTAVTEAVPDEMVWSVEVRNQDAKLDGVAAEHSKTVASVLSFLKELRIAEKKIQTSRMELNENRQYLSSSWVKSGYYAKTDISFKLAEFELYKKLWTGLAKIPGVSIHNVSYDSTKRIDYRKESRQKALVAAKEKAVEMVKVLGSEVGEPLLIEEDLSVSEGWQGNQAVLTANSLSAVENVTAQADEQLALGTIPIRARVKVSFRLVTLQK